jgi:hypothetical protein
VTVDNQPPIESAFDVAIKQIAAGARTLMAIRGESNQDLLDASAKTPVFSSVVAFDMAVRIAFRVWAATRGEPALESTKPAVKHFPVEHLHAPKLAENAREKEKTTWQVTVSQPLDGPNKNGDSFSAEVLKQFTNPSLGVGYGEGVSVPSGGPPSDIFGRRHDGPVLVEPQDTLALEREGYEPGPWSEDFGGKLYGAGMSLSYGQPLRPWRKPHDPTGKTFFEGGQPKLAVCFDGIEFCSGELRVLGPDAKVTHDHLTAVYALEKDEKLTDAKMVTLREFAEMLIQLRWKRYGASVGLNQNLAAALRTSPLGRIVLSQHEVPRGAAP